MEAVIVISEISEVANTCPRTHGSKTEVCLIIFVLLFINSFYFILTVKYVAVTCEPADACLKILVIGSSYITVCPSSLLLEFCFGSIQHVFIYVWNFYKAIGELFSQLICLYRTFNFWIGCDLYCLEV